MTATQDQLNVDFVRSHFPAIVNNPEYIFSENAGGSQVLASVVSRLSSYLLESNVQMAAYPLAHTAAAKVERGTYAAAFLVGADSKDEVLLGQSATQIAENMARMIERTLEKRREGEPGETWNEGDEIIVSQSDHETNIGAWARLAARNKLTLKVWPVTPLPSSQGGSDSNPYAVGLDPAVLSTLLTPRTRLVAFTGCSNVLGTFTPIREITSLVASKTGGKALVAVDCVAFAPHRPMRPKEWGVDMAIFSLYKTYGPHIGIGYVAPRARDQWFGKLNHFFLHDAQGAGTYPYTPSSQQYELIYSITAVADYLVSLADANKREEDWTQVYTSPQHRQLLDAAFAKIARHEEELQRILVDFLVSQHPRGVRIVGSESHRAEIRAPTVAFVVVDKEGKPQPLSKRVHQALVEDNKLGAQQGHMYAYRLVEKLGLDIQDGVVRVSFVHYNTTGEVEQFCAALGKVLDRLV
ncbi:uncharacterized protein PFL1_04264 [Pseudozyma flocculosa PF-1]|uniref:Aminotransferase class V domain-containing protein n=2 Tax=Pseudozyma flocculosa TaxID=84751 RepID=A0A5C3EWY9_9BASI|nr:uncharacterized protein PFL1_04264 [Pseudozyma flocculosa PF-1]EPQ28438.1 hypothetical protein PFL1_04264 [Pseudozyma flocculosa PF-1]SPO35611.1 uncharacterized protein PSFLO_01082 [Pseudozyma flocculosa]